MSGDKKGKKKPMAKKGPFLTLNPFSSKKKAEKKKGRRGMHLPPFQKTHTQLV
jgi:hypothetical protein